MMAEPKFHAIVCGYLKVEPSELAPKIGGGEIAKIGSVKNVSTVILLVSYYRS